MIYLNVIELNMQFIDIKERALRLCKIYNKNVTNLYL